MRLPSASQPPVVCRDSHHPKDDEDDEAMFSWDLDFDSQDAWTILDGHEHPAGNGHTTDLERRMG